MAFGYAKPFYSRKFRRQFPSYGSFLGFNRMVNGSRMRRY